MEQRDVDNWGGPTLAAVPACEGEPGDSPRCLVVMYHYVRPPDPELAGGVRGLTPEQFARQLDRLCAEREPIGWSQLDGWIQHARPLPARSFLLTFDDGLADHAATVLPLLEERALRGVFFVPGTVLAPRRLLAAHAIHVLMGTLGQATFETELLAELARRRADMDAPLESLGNEAGRVYHYEPPAIARIKYLLHMALPIEVRNEVVDALFERFVGSGVAWARRWYLRPEDLTTMQARGHTIGGHGFSHEPYRRLSRSQQHADAKRAADVLDGHLGAARRPFSYPFGSIDDDSADACARAGFVAAFTTCAALLGRNSLPLHLPRVDTIDVEARLAEDGVNSAGQGPLCHRTPR